MQSLCNRNQALPPTVCPLGQRRTGTCCNSRKTGPASSLLPRTKPTFDYGPTWCLPPHQESCRLGSWHKGCPPTLETCNSQKAPLCSGFQGSKMAAWPCCSTCPDIWGFEGSLTQDPCSLYMTSLLMQPLLGFWRKGSLPARPPHVTAGMMLLLTPNAYLCQGPHCCPCSQVSLLTKLSWG